MEALAEDFFLLTRLTLVLRPFNGTWGFGGVFNIRFRTSSRVGFLGMAVPPGFAYQIIYGAKNLPYPVKVILPPIQGGRDPATPIRTRGREIDLVIPESNERHDLLGRFLDQWSLLESMLHFFAEKLIETDLRTTKYVMNALGTRQIIELVVSLATLKLDDAQTARLITLFERVGKLNSKRNVLVHGYWLLEAVVLVDREGEAFVKSQFVRAIHPADAKIADMIHNPRNQKERVKYIFTFKRIEGATKDVAALAADLGRALQQIQVSSAWRKLRSTIVPISRSLDSLWSTYRIDPIRATHVTYTIQL